MRAPRRILLLFCTLFGALPIQAETWSTSSGPSIEGQLSGVFGSIATVSCKGGTALISLGLLDDAGLARVADFLDTSAKAQPAWADSRGKVAASLRRRLQVVKDGKLVAFDPGARPEPVIYLVYFGAHWCRPCREFSPKLVAAYQRLRETASDRFELVFVSNDHSREEQASYAREVGMPWPILKFSDIGSVPAIERWAGPGIPDLVVLTRSGDAIFNSYHGDEYVGPEQVLDEAESLMGAMDADSQACRRALHRLSVLRHVRGAVGGTSNPKPYMMGLDASRYQTLEIRKVSALISIDEGGHVTDVKIEPQLPSVLEYQLEQDARSWLFLPAVAGGRPVQARVSLPIRF